jgi:hypothetical protein
MLTAALVREIGMLKSSSCEMVVSVAVVVVSTDTGLAVTSTVSVRPPRFSVGRSVIVRPALRSRFCSSYGRNPESSARML